MSDAVEQAALSSWTLPFWATSLLLLTALVYLRGLRRIRQTRPELFPSWRMWSFLAGLLFLWIALASPLDTLDNLLLAAHMTQHLVLMSVAPPLLLLGAPVVPLLRGLPRPLVRDGLGPFFQAQVVDRISRVLTHRPFAWFAMNIAFLGWHVPRAYELALRSAGWHAVEHACFFLTSLLFWFPVIQPWPSVSRGSPWILLPYLLAADLVNTALSAFLTFSGRLLYPSYGLVPGVFGISALGDQVAAGALMWVLGSVVYLAPLVVITVRLLSPRGYRYDPARFRTRPVPKPAPRFDALRLPLVGWFLRARYGRMALQSIAFAAAVLVIADGFRGPQMGAMNLAGVLPWTYLRVCGVVALLVVGNVFCMSCPFMLPRELGHRLGVAKLNWPRWLQTKWVAIALLILFFWSYENFSIWDHPQRTAWLLIFYFAAALLVDTFFRGANFCKYLCPLGQFNFTASLLSPFTLETRSQATCDRCATHDCIAGNQRQRGCELQLYLPRKVGNMDCTLCMDCVKACPHDNIGLFVLPPGSDVLRDPIRSSIGRSSSRVDLAVLAQVIVFSAFANAAVMVSPLASTMAVFGQSLAQRARSPVIFSVLSALLVMSVVAVVILAMLLANLAGLRLSPQTSPSRMRAGGVAGVRELFCRFSLALLPLGLAMWAAHLLFHLSTGWGTLGPALHQMTGDLGWHFLAPPQWGMVPALVSANSLLSMQLLILDLGMLSALYLGWRLARQFTGQASRAVLLLLPWGISVVLFYAAGVWILVQPMQMRGVMNP